MVLAMETAGTPRICTTDMEMLVGDVLSMMDITIAIYDKDTCRVQV